MTDLRQEQLTVAGTPLHVVTAGPADAPALVLLHGWPESSATWRELIPLAAAGLTGHQPRTVEEFLHDQRDSFR